MKEESERRERKGGSLRTGGEKGNTALVPEAEREGGRSGEMGREEHVETILVEVNGEENGDRIGTDLNLLRHFPPSTVKRRKSGSEGRGNGKLLSLRRPRSGLEMKTGQNESLIHLKTLR